MREVSVEVAKTQTKTCNFPRDVSSSFVIARKTFSSSSSSSSFISASFIAAEMISAYSTFWPGARPNETTNRWELLSFRKNEIIKVFCDVFGQNFFYFREEKSRKIQTTQECRFLRALIFSCQVRNLFFSLSLLLLIVNKSFWDEISLWWRHKVTVEFHKFSRLQCFERSLNANVKNCEQLVTYNLYTKYTRSENLFDNSESTFTRIKIWFMGSGVVTVCFSLTTAHAVTCFFPRVTTTLKNLRNVIAYNVNKSHLKHTTFSLPPP